MSISRQRLFSTGLVVAVASLCVALTPVDAVAQSRQFTGRDASSLNAVYGRGVHAYFAGRLSEADRLLTQAAEAGSRDPRVYYFRAMTRMGMGRRYEAEQDMRIGAAMEARSPGLGRSIGRSLVRVQGGHRRQLEQFRREARLNVAQANLQEAQSRYNNATRPREVQVLRRPARVPLEQLVEPSISVVTPESSAPATARPTSPPPATSRPTLVAEPEVAEPAEAPQPEPVEESTPPTDNTLPEPAEEDPFGGPFGAPEESTTDESTPEPTPVEPAPQPADDISTDDIFGAEDPAPMLDEDGFGAEATLEDASQDAAAADEPDPFGAEQPAPPAEPSEPSETGDDPFGASDDDDAFGESTAAASEGQATQTEASAGSTGSAEPSKFLGVLSRVVGGVVPSVPVPQLPELPQVGGPPEMAGEEPAAFDAFELGPAEEAMPGDAQFNESRGDASQPALGAGEPSASPAVAEDPFGGFGDDDAVEQAAPAEQSVATDEEPADGPPAEEDPFGGFTDDEPAEEAPATDGSATEDVSDAEEAEADTSDADEAAEDADSDTEGEESSSSEEEDPFGGFGDFE